MGNVPELAKGDRSLLGSKDREISGPVPPHLVRRRVSCRTGSWAGGREGCLGRDVSETMIEENGKRSSWGSEGTDGRRVGCSPVRSGCERLVLGQLRFVDARGAEPGDRCGPPNGSRVGARDKRRKQISGGLSRSPRGALTPRAQRRCPPRPPRPALDKRGQRVSPLRRAPPGGRQARGEDSQLLLPLLPFFPPPLRILASVITTNCSLFRFDDSGRTTATCVLTLSVVRVATRLRSASRPFAPSSSRSSPPWSHRGTLARARTVRQPTHRQTGTTTTDRLVSRDHHTSSRGGRQRGSKVSALGLGQEWEGVCSSA